MHGMKIVHPSVNRRPEKAQHLNLQDVSGGQVFVKNFAFVKVLHSLHYLKPHGHELLG